MWKAVHDFHAFCNKALLWVQAAELTLQGTTQGLISYMIEHFASDSFKQTCKRIKPYLNLSCCAVPQDHTNGAGYVAYSSENNRVMHISRLTPDFTNVQNTYNPVFAQLGREAPAMFKFKNVFLLATSGCTGWEPNELEVFWAL